MAEFRLYRESSGTSEIVEPEKWRWIARYNDGTMLHQFDERDFSFHQFREIQQDNLHSFIMVTEGKPPIILLWEKGRKLIHFYNHICLDFGGPNETRLKVYCFGYEEPGHKVIFMIMPDDGIVITDDHNKIKVNTA
jgi:hypothetical protein